MSNVRIRRQRWLLPPAQTDQTSLPFQYSIADRRLELSFPAFARVACRTGRFRWRLLHDGSRWAEIGVVAQEDPIQLSLPLHTAVWVCAHGQNWILDWPGDASTVQELRGAEFAESKYFVSSLALHAMLFGGLIGVRVLHQYWLQRSLEGIEGKSRLVDIQMTTGPGGLRSYVPFSGISYGDFKVRKAEEKKVTDAELAMAALQGMDFKKGDTAPGGGKGPGGESRTALQQQLAQSQTNQNAGPDLSEKLDSDKFKGDLDGAKKQVEAKPLTPRDQAVVRERFRALQDSFRKVYSRTLSVDPSLAVTIVFAAEVTPSGYLKLAHFDARGTYTSEGLSQLRTGIAALLQSTRVDGRLAGTVIRGENVFVR